MTSDHFEFSSKPEHPTQSRSQHQASESSTLSTETLKDQPNTEDGPLNEAGIRPPFRTF